MKWIYTIQNKMTASIALIILCCMILLSNYNDRQHTREVKTSINTLYEDRLVAESYILNLTDYMHQVKEILLNAKHSPSDNSSGLHSIFASIENTENVYEKTKFTPEETATYREFKRIFEQIKSNQNEEIENKILLSNSALAKLNILSKIQIQESKGIIQRSDQLFNAGILSSKFSMTMIIFIALLLQALVFASRTLHPYKQSGIHQLN